MKSFKPVFVSEVEGAADTQQAANIEAVKSDATSITTVEDPISTGYRPIASGHRVDRWLDATARFAGSAPIFTLIVTGILAWASLGVHYGTSKAWVAAISDIQALLCYVFDTLLMRQLLRKHTEQRAAMVRIQSRSSSHQRMLLKVKARLGSAETQQISERCSREALQPFSRGVRDQTLFSRCIIFTAKRLGHVTTALLYWVCICVWLGFGPWCHCSNKWQLYINDATSALMVLIFAFLACLRECHADYTTTYLDAIFRVDSVLESGLRALTEDQAPNPVGIDKPIKENYLQNAIYYYATYNTWWLLIGTYAGLVGLFDSFVLRNVQSIVHQNNKSFIRKIESLDEDLLRELSLWIPAEQDVKAPSLTRRVSRKMDAISSHLLMVVAGFLMTVGCLTASSAMHCSLTGQLISNVPPSVIETFMLILITGQNDAEAAARVDLTNIYYRRQRLLAFVKNVTGSRERQSEEVIINRETVSLGD
ncbi:Uncharacterized protein PECH_005220 [Penicillium ucsense]|uniref:Uncharacterized protein n=1 Tax=Penicillium ucsense TaxID=2839758 RepID=A0A8J8WBN6_9EURO|nr:Uncharacterized protein PECM_006346 [Penicillium ucsense]KAF7736487.1 Uncharacterized protein PECH_005220 [Penicillium ucsense]